ncbi:helix-turn-helix domain-containing protein [Enterococcus sp. 2201sp1_2201st1_B8_2201SCRN_220225]|uniref:helix-turn-helix domain-containing protein n=1 Tax=unclassified Enterococcus TaxID=2608891 RepID=UPI0034A14EA0
MANQNTSLAFRLSKNLYLLMGQERIIKNKELAEMSGVDVNTISKIKNGWDGDFAVTTVTIEKLAKALNVDCMDLLKEV